MARATSKAGTTTEKGLAIERRFTTAGRHPFDELEWEIRDAVIGDPDDPAFEQRHIRGLVVNNQDFGGGDYIVFHGSNFLLTQ